MQLSAYFDRKARPSRQLQARLLRIAETTLRSLQNLLHYNSWYNHAEQKRMETVKEKQVYTLENQLACFLPAYKSI